MLDPAIAAFAADQDATFDQAFSARPIKEQRALYEEFWRRYHAPRPGGVEATDFNVLGLSGQVPVIPARIAFLWRCRARPRRLRARVGGAVSC